MGKQLILVLWLSASFLPVFAQQPIQKRTVQPDGLELVSWSYSRSNRGNTPTEFFRFGLFDPKKNKMVLDMQYSLVRYGRTPGKYIVRDTATFRHALYDATERSFLTPVIYHQIGDFSEGVSTVTFHDSTAKGTKSSVLSLDGKRANFIYDFLSEPTLGRLRYKQSGRWGLIQPDGTIVRTADFVDMHAISEGLIGVRYEEKGLLGFIDVRGKEVIPPSFEDAGIFVRGRAVAYVKRAGWKFTQGTGTNDQAGLINTRGEFVIPPAFTSIDNPPGSRSIYIVTNADRKKGIYDANGKLIQDFTISYISTWSNGKSEISLTGSGKIGWMDTLGRWIVLPTYDALNTKLGSHASARSRSRYDIFDSTGRKLLTIDSATKVVLGKTYVLSMLHKKQLTILDYKGKKIKTIEQPGFNDLSTDFLRNTDSVLVAYSNLTTVHHVKTPKQTFITGATEVSSYQDDLLLVKNNDGFFWTDLTGRRLSKKNYAEAQAFSHGISVVRPFRNEFVFKVVNRAGVEIADVPGDLQSAFSDGILLFKLGLKKQVVALDSLGKTLWAVDSAVAAKSLGNGYVAVQQVRGKFQLYTAKGKLVADSLFDQLGTANDGVIGFKRNGRFGYMNYQGNVIVDPIYDGATNSGGHIIAVKLGPQVTIINPKGKRLNDSTYTEARDPADGIVAVAREKKWGLVQATGRTLVPCLHEDLIWAAENRIFVKRGKDWFLTDYQGQAIGGQPYEYAERFHEGYGRVRHKGKLGIIDMQANWVLKPVYTNLTVVRNQQVVSFESSGSKVWAIKN